MRKLLALLFLAALLAIGIRAFGEEDKTLNGYVMAGYIPLTALSTEQFYFNTYYLDINISIKIFNFIKIGGDIETDMYMEQLSRFAPFMAEYKIFASLYYKNFEIGAYHVCRHTMSNEFINTLLPENIKEITVNYGQSVFFIKYNF